MTEVAPWSMTEDGEWILNEPYATKLAEAKHVASQAWIDAICSFLHAHTGYPADELNNEFVRRAVEKDEPPMEIVDSFVIEVLERSI